MEGIVRGRRRGRQGGENRQAGHSPTAWYPTGYAIGGTRTAEGTVLPSLQPQPISRPHAHRFPYGTVKAQFRRKRSHGALLIHRLPCSDRLCRSRDIALPTSGAAPFRIRIHPEPEYGFRAHGLKRVSHSPASSPYQYSRNAFTRNAAMLARPNGGIAERARNSLPNCEIDYISENLSFRIVNTK